MTLVILSIIGALIMLVASVAGLLIATEADVQDRSDQTSETGRVQA